MIRKLVIVLLCIFFVNTIAHSEGAYYISRDSLPTAVKNELGDNDFISGFREGSYLYLLLKNSMDDFWLRIYFTEDNTFHAICSSGVIPMHDGIEPSIRNAGDAKIDICYQGSLYATYEISDNNLWVLRRVVGSNDTIEFTTILGAYTRNWLDDSISHIYPCSSPISLTSQDTLTLPTSLEDVSKLTESDGRALVALSNADKRVNLRKEPSVSSDSLGIYYNGTPVVVLRKEAGWAQVEVAGTEGYIKNDLLRYGMDMLSVNCAFPLLDFKKATLENGIPLYENPWQTAGLVTVLSGDNHDENDVVIIGAIRDEWYHVICTNGQSGYVMVKDLE